MNSTLRDKFFGQTVEERLELVPGELAIDAVGLWQIVSFGREGFELTGPELVDYVRKHLFALLAKGAKPVIGALDDVHYWVPVHYGHADNEIVKNIIAEWQLSGTDPDVGGVWFALPHIYEATRGPKNDKRRLD